MNNEQPMVRAAGLGDLDALVAGNLALAEETERVRLDADTLRQGIRALLESRAPGRYWVAELEGRVVGQLLITFEWSDWRNRMVWWIQSVYVVPDARGRGVFRTLYDAARREALAAGQAACVCMSTRPISAPRKSTRARHEWRPLSRIRRHVRRAAELGRHSVASDR